MSRLPPRLPLSSVPVVTAADLDTRFTDFATASATINQDNLRDGGIDLPQYAAQQIIKFAQTVIIGPSDWDLTTNVVVLAATATPSPAPTTPVAIVDPTAANASVINFGLAGQALTLVDVLRVSWNLKVNVVYAGTPYDSAGARGRITYTTPASSTVTISDALHAWPFYLQWDITSSALANFVAVPGQTTFQDVLTIPAGSTSGGRIDQCFAASFHAPWVSRGVGVSNAEVTSGLVYARGWRSIKGTLFYTPPLGVTVYGLRVVHMPALYHPSFDSGSNENVMGYDAIASVGVSLQHQSGHLTAVVQRLQ